MKRNQKVLGLILAVVLGMAVFTGCSEEKLVATVNGENITKTEFDSTFDSFKMQYEQQFGADVWNQDTGGRKFIDVAKEKILDVEIGFRLEAKKAKEMGLSVSDAEVKKQLDDAKTYFGTEEKFNEFLTAQKMTLESFNDSMKKQILSSKLQEKINEKTTVTDQEIEAYFKANQAEFEKASASHILLKTLDEAKAVKARIDAGEDFATVAKAVSTDPSVKENGGNMGSFAYGDMVEPFSKAAFAMKSGDVSDPVETEFGFHIIKSAGVKQETLAEVKESIRTKLLTTKRDDVYAKMMDELTKSATIKKFPENLTTASK